MNKEDMIKLVEAFYDDKIKAVGVDYKGKLFVGHNDWNEAGIGYETDIKLDLNDRVTFYKSLLGIAGIKSYVKDFKYQVGELSIIGSHYDDKPIMVITKN